MAKPLRFSEADHARIAAAIREAEAATSGEIFAVFARSSDGYFFVSAFFALLLSLAAGVLTALAAWLSDATLPAMALEITQVASAAALLILLRLSTGLRMLLVPKSLQVARARETALAQFRAHGIEATSARTGVLLFVSEAEHHAEVVADAGIDAKVPQEEWDAIVALLVEAAASDRLADGFVDAVRHAGRLLAAHFPSRDTNPNELPDRLVEL